MESTKLGTNRNGGKRGNLKYLQAAFTPCKQAVQKDGGGSRAATRVAIQGGELKRRLREAIQNGSIVVDHVDAYQGFWLTKETVTNSTDRR